MAQKKGYSRYFIILQQDENGYSVSSDKLPSGYTKLETKSDKCKITYYVQNIRKELEPYYMVLICSKKDTKKIINLGEMNIDEYGRAEITYEYSTANIAGSTLPIDLVTGAAIIKQDGSKIISVMSGFASADPPSDWKGFHLLNENRKESVAEEKVEKAEKKPEKAKKKVKETEKEETIIEESSEQTKVFEEYERKIEELKQLKDKLAEEEKKEEKIDIKEELKVEEKEDIKAEEKTEKAEEVKEKVKTEEKSKDQVKEEIKEEVKVSLEEKVRKEIQEKLEQEIEEKVRREIEEKVKKEIEEKVKAEIKEEVIQKEKVEEKAEEDSKKEIVDEHRTVKDGSSKEQEYPLGTVGEFFKSLAKDFEEVQGACTEIKRCKWYKVNVESMQDMNSESDYNKYTIIYYPMMSYYPYINKHKHFLLGYKYDKEGKMKYIVYGIAGSKNIYDQPYGGKSGFVTWVSEDEADTRGEQLGYWLMFYDFKTSTIVVPARK